MIAKVASIYRSEYKNSEEKNDAFSDNKNKPQQTFCELLMVALRKKSLHNLNTNKKLVDNNAKMAYTK
ncbi:hypothetical protein SPFL3102_00351 [Sporomusaceae bacterium FL31]|nr:hypothetical protein SPFL3101_01843 [Sporomusaceae bacterium FL31]GCE32565.1 hypothetical protein SPFL3102_00351 [Sporomusaceae bacterium]